MRREANADSKLKANKDQATRLYLDPQHVMSPTHSAKLALYMLKKEWTAKIHAPADDVDAR